MSSEYETTQDDTGHGDTSADQTAQTSTGGEPVKASPVKASPQDEKLVQKILQRIRKDKHHHSKAFKRMEASMFMALHGRAKDWPETNYKANIAGRHVEQKTASLYAKNPKIVARRKDSLDFVLWDETLESIQLAAQTMQAGMQVQAANMQAAQVASLAEGVFAPPASGHNGGPPLDEPAEMPLPPGYDEAVALMQDFQQGMARRQLLKKFGKTLELVFADALRRQTPLDFKSAMKGVVCRALTTAVGYVEMGFQDVYGIPSATTERLADDRRRIAHLEKLIEDENRDDLDECRAEIAELQASIEALQSQDQIILRSGLTFDFLQATKVIPDRLCTSVVGFIGSRHITLEYLYTKLEVEEMFKVKLSSNYTPYLPGGKRSDGERGVDTGIDTGGDDGGNEGVFGASGSDDDLVCLYKHYDKTSGLVYHLVDGHKCHIKPPQAPDVTVPRFWPVYTVTFNRSESESEAFPKSDVERIKDVQDELNRSRQGKREHRNAARPRWAYSNGVFDEKDIESFKSAEAFDAFALNGLGGDMKLTEALQAVPVPGVDPNLYDTNEVMQDASLTVGAQGAQLGGTTKGTATGVAVANESVSSLDNSSIDDLDASLTAMARDGGQILMTNLTKEDVVKIAGVGAVWIEDLGMTHEQIFDEMYLEIEAGSSGKPNQAKEIQTLKEIGPLLLQVGSIPAPWLAKEMLRRWDDRLDLTEAVVAGLPAIVAANRMAQPAQGDPQADPNQQGGEGGDKNKTPSGPSGSAAPMGNNQSPGV